MKHPDRKQLRLKEFDYVQAASYFITIVTHDRFPLFGTVDSGVMDIKPMGKIIESCWLRLEERFPRVILGEYVVMPNHLHAVLSITDSAINGAGQNGGCALGDVIGAFKSISTHTCILAVRNGAMPPFRGKIWQRNYYEHIIRNDKDWEQISRYIATNPAGWEEDEENPTGKRSRR